MTIGESFKWHGRTATVLDIERNNDRITAVCVRIGNRPARWFTSDATINEIQQARAKSLMAVLL
jgi:hypothetical protein